MKKSLMEQINELWQNLVSDMVYLFPKLVLALIILFAGWLVARICQKIIIRIILFLDNRVNAQLRSSFLSVDLKQSAHFIARTVFWIIILFSVAIVTQTLGVPVLTSWFDELVNFLPNILAAVVIMLAGIIASRLASDLIGSAAAKTEIAVGRHLKKIVQFLILFIAGVIAINQIGIDINFLTTLVTIVIAALLFGAALAFGLGARTSISNILGSYYIQKTYQEGNFVRIGKIEGEIVKITPTAVYLKTKSGQVTIPAKDFNESKSILLKESNHAD